MFRRGQRSGLRLAADTIITVLAAVVVVIFAVMMLLVFVQVIDRFAPGPSFFWSEEVVRILLVWSVMLGLPVVLYLHEEISADVLNLSPGRERWRQRLASFFGAVFLVILAWQGWIFMVRSIGFLSPTLGISRGWIYAPIPIGAALGAVCLMIRPRRHSPDPSDAETGKRDTQ